MHHETRTHTKEPAKTTGSTPSESKQRTHFLRLYTPQKSASESLLPFCWEWKEKRLP